MGDELCCIDWGSEVAEQEEREREQEQGKESDGTD